MWSPSSRPIVDRHDDGCCILLHAFCVLPRASCLVPPASARLVSYSSLSPGSSSRVRHDAGRHFYRCRSALKNPASLKSRPKREYDHSNSAEASRIVCLPCEIPSNFCVGSSVVIMQGEGVNSTQYALCERYCQVLWMGDYHISNSHGWA